MDFGPKLRLLRVASGLSLSECANRLGVSSAYLSRVEHGHDAPPTPDRLFQLARILQVPPEALIELTDRVSSVLDRYLARVPAARSLFLEIAHRDLSPAQLARLRAQLGDQDASHSRIDLAACFDESRIVLALSCESYEDVLEICAMRLSPRVHIPARTLCDRMKHRERFVSSLCGGGMALPSVTIPELSSPVAVFITLASPLVAPTPDRRPLRVVMAVAAPNEGPSLQGVLLELVRFGKSDLAQSTLQSNNPKDVLQRLREFELEFGSRVSH